MVVYFVLRNDFFCHVAFVDKVAAAWSIWIFFVLGAILCERPIKRDGTV